MTLSSASRERFIANRAKYNNNRGGWHRESLATSAEIKEQVAKANIVRVAFDASGFAVDGVPIAKTLVNPAARKAYIARLSAVRARPGIRLVDLAKLFDTPPDRFLYKHLRRAILNRHICRKELRVINLKGHSFDDYALYLTDSGECWLKSVK